MPNSFISEDRFVHWVKSQGGALHTRKYSNISKIDLSHITLVCLSGFDHVIQTFFLKKIHGSVVIDGDESWIQPFGEGESLKYPFWATRTRN